MRILATSSPPARVRLQGYKRECVQALDQQFQIRIKLHDAKRQDIGAEQVRESLSDQLEFAHEHRERVAVFPAPFSVTRGKLPLARAKGAALVHQAVDDGLKDCGNMIDAPAIVEGRLFQLGVTLDGVQNF